MRMSPSSLIGRVFAATLAGLGLTVGFAPSFAADEVKNGLDACRSEDIAVVIPACTVIIDKADATPPDKANAYILRARALTALAYDEDSKSADNWRACLTEPLDAALEACTRIIDNPAEPGSRRADALYNRSKHLIDKGRPADAMADFQRSLKPFPDRAPGSREKALADYTSALALEPGNSGTLAARGYLYMGLDDIDAALGDFDKALSINASEGLALFGRALLRNAKGDPVGAVADLKAVVAIPVTGDEGKWLNQKATEMLSSTGAD